MMSEDDFGDRGEESRDYNWITCPPPVSDSPPIRDQNFREGERGETKQTQK